MFGHIIGIIDQLGIVILIPLFRCHYGISVKNLYYHVMHIIVGKRI